MGTRKQWMALLAILISGSAVATIAFGNLGESLIYFWDPQELLAQGEKAHGATVRLGGVVQRDSVDWNADTLELKFAAGIQPEGAPSVKVHAKGAPPQMFREGIGVVVEGSYNGEVFQADRVLVKHSNEYRAPKEGESSPKDVLKTLVETSSR